MYVITIHTGRIHHDRFTHETQATSIFTLVLGEIVFHLFLKHLWLANMVVHCAFGDVCTWHEHSRCAEAVLTVKETRPDRGKRKSNIFIENPVQLCRFVRTYTLEITPERCRRLSAQRSLSRQEEDTAGETRRSMKRRLL